MTIASDKWGAPSGDAFENQHSKKTESSYQRPFERDQAIAPVLGLSSPCIKSK